MSPKINVEDRICTEWESYNAGTQQWLLTIFGPTFTDEEREQIQATIDSTRKAEIDRKEVSDRKWDELLRKYK